MTTVTSKDGTTIAYEKSGSGPALILVDGALSRGSDSAEFAAILSENFTVYSYDRRGRGDSGDTPPYAVEREIEDIDALVEAAGGSVYAFGSSSGASLALEAASRLGGKISKAVLHEPPYIVDDSVPPVPANYAEHVSELVAAGKRGEAIEYFMTAVVGVPAEYLQPMRDTPMWAAMEDLAHTIPYDAQVMGHMQDGKPLPRDRWSGATLPIRVVIGSESHEFFRNTAKALVEILPNAHSIMLEGADHSAVQMAPAPLAAAVVEHLNG